MHFFPQVRGACASHFVVQRCRTAPHLLDLAGKLHTRNDHSVVAPGVERAFNPKPRTTSGCETLRAERQGYRGPARTAIKNSNRFYLSQVDLSALVPGEFGKLGDPLPMSVGVKESSAVLAIQHPSKLKCEECNEAAKAKEQTHVALQAGLGNNLVDVQNEEAAADEVAGASQAETMQNNFLGELSDRIATAAKAQF